MKKKKWMGLAIVLICALFAGAIIPSTMNAAQKKSTQKKNTKKVLVVYFSATGTTKEAAKKVKKATGGTLYEIKAKTPYTEADLDYSQADCRANKEQQDDSVRPAIKGKVKNIQKYDLIFVGYPIWWGKEPKIIRTFLESYNLKGKTIVPFCTSGSSGISGSMDGVKAAAEGATVVSGKDLTGLSYNDVKKWAKKKL